MIANILTGDCRIVLPGAVPAGTVDLAFVDPPFNLAVDYGESYNDNRPLAEYLTDVGGILSTLYRLLRPGGALWVHVGQGVVSEVDVFCKSLGAVPINKVVLSYRFGVCTDARFIDAAAFGLYYVKPPKTSRTWNPVLVPSDRASTYADARSVSGLRVPLSVWGWAGDGGEFWGRVQGNSAERRPLHPNQLPERYLQRIIRSVTRPGDLVIDGCTGSGTTGVVAAQLGRRFIGAEINAAFAESARERITRGAVRIPET